MTCPDCGGVMVLRDGPRGRPFWSCSRWPMCSGRHAAREDGTPLGTPADKATRRARVTAHRAFDLFRRRTGWTRDRAYAWLAVEMGMPPSRCHIARLDEAGCRRVVEVVTRAEERPRRANRRMP